MRTFMPIPIQTPYDNDNDNDNIYSHKCTNIHYREEVGKIQHIHDRI